MSDKLNLGCGHFYREGFVNVDRDPDSPADVIHDLDRSPYPFADGSFDYIEMSHVLEHLEHTSEAMREISRILRPGGTVLIRVPHFSRGFTHWDHKRGFDVSFPYYFTPGISGGFADVSLCHKSTRLTWFAQKSFKKQVLSPPLYYGGVILGAIFDFIGNLNHFFTSRLLCYWVGGYEEIEFVFTKVNQPSQG
jgi:SAM-dependent methyltransferase